MIVNQTPKYGNDVYVFCSHKTSDTHIYFYLYLAHTHPSCDISILYFTIYEVMSCFIHYCVIGGGSSIQRGQTNAILEYTYQHDLDYF